MTGSGNDFVMVDARLSAREEWSAADIRAACARGTGVGADGVVFVGPGSTAGSARMTYFNSDGSHAAMCGNAALCATRLAARLGLAPAAGMRLETDAGVIESRCYTDDHRAELRLAAAEPPRAVQGLSTAHGERRAVLGVVGVPHLVVLVDDVDTVDLERRGRALRADRALGPPGANVNFISPGPRASQWRMRTYERGVEAETLACGTGAVTAAMALDGWGLGHLPTTVITRSGQRLEVSGRRTNGGLYDELWLSGEARLVFRGVLT
ncbi:MAG: diaminopimelate epimerase [Gemmatimonadales bacterium]